MLAPLGKKACSSAKVAFILRIYITGPTILDYYLLEARLKMRGCYMSEPEAMILRRDAKVVQLCLARDEDSQVARNT